MKLYYYLDFCRNAVNIRVSYKTKYLRLRCFFFLVTLGEQSLISYDRAQRTFPFLLFNINVIFVLHFF